MRLLLIGNYPLDGASSMDRYAEMLRRELSLRGHTVVIRRPPAVVGRVWPRGMLGKWLGYVDKYMLFPLRIASLAKGWDRVHICDHSNAIYLPQLPEERASITCHDVIAIDAAAGAFPEVEVGRRVGWTGRVQQRWIRGHLLKARRVVAVSHSTAERLQAMGAVGEICVIHNPLHRRFVPAGAEAVATVRQRLGIAEGQRYLLHVGGNHWYKHRPGVLRIFEALRRHEDFSGMVLVMVGPRWTEAMQAYVREHGLKSATREALAMDDADLEALYTGAEALLFPSLHEGFGWPPIEAQSCETVVISSDRAGLREIAGDGAIFVDPLTPEDAAAAVAAAWPEREAIRLRGMMNALRFAPGPLVDAYEAFFEAELPRGRGARA